MVLGLKKGSYGLVGGSKKATFGGEEAAQGGGSGRGAHVEVDQKNGPQKRDLFLPPFIYILN